MTFKIFGFTVSITKNIPHRVDDHNYTRMTYNTAYNYFLKEMRETYANVDGKKIHLIKELMDRVKEATGYPLHLKDAKEFIECCWTYEEVYGDQS